MPESSDFDLGDRLVALDREEHVAGLDRRRRSCFSHSTTVPASIVQPRRGITISIGTLVLLTMPLRRGIPPLRRNDRSSGAARPANDSRHRGSATRGLTEQTSAL